LLIRVWDGLGRRLSCASLEGFEAVAASVLREVDDWLDGVVLVMSHGSIGRSYTNLQDLHLVSDNSPLLLIGVPLRFLDICVCLLDCFV
jgi:hypothetical protein